MSKHKFSLFSTLVLLFLQSSLLFAMPKEPVDYVNTLMGSQSTYELSHGNTYPAISMPWGMNSWTPQTSKMGDGWTYKYTDNKILGFKQTHQPSPWINDYGQFSLMPIVGKTVIEDTERASWFSHKAEIATPYYYRVYLADYNTTTELSPTERACIFRITFPKTDSAKVVVDAFDKGSFIKIEPEKNRIVGYSTKNSGGVTDNFKNYFVIQFNAPFTSIESWNDSTISSNHSQRGNHTGAVVGFAAHNLKNEIIARVASSFVSEEQAIYNLKELGNDTFDQVKAKGRETWNKMLSRIEVKDDNLDNIRTFYTTHYRSLLFPRKLYEHTPNGEIVHYSPFNGNVEKGYLYTDTGFWDTFRALFPMLNLLYPDVNKEIQEGLINTYKESGFFPEWASPGHRNCMIGNNSASVLIDAYLKGVKVNDVNALFDGVIHGTKSVDKNVSSTGRLGWEEYNRLGYVPCNVGINESAARTLEYAYADWCIYQLAKKLNKPKAVQDLFAKRAMNYKNLFDPTHKLMRGKLDDGTLETPFSPFKWGGVFTEGNSWHYTWSVFQDVQGLIELMGGDKSFVQMLDSIFTLPPIFDASYYGFVIHEIREMQIIDMGNYAHGNQPIQHVIYLYDFAGEPWKAQYRIREVMNKLYKATPDGYCGDEDNGQTSAWYLFSALGFYPVTPATDQYVLGTPLFKSVKLHFPNGKTTTLNAPENSSENFYLNSVTLNGAPHRNMFFTHKELTNGCNIIYNMSNKANRNVVDKKYRPYSLSLELKKY